MTSTSAATGGDVTEARQRVSELAAEAARLPDQLREAQRAADAERWLQLLNRQEDVAGELNRAHIDLAVALADDVCGRDVGFDELDQVDGELAQLYETVRGDEHALGGTVEGVAGARRRVAEQRVELARRQLADAKEADHAERVELEHTAEEAHAEQKRLDEQAREAGQRALNAESRARELRRSNDIGPRMRTAQDVLAGARRRLAELDGKTVQPDDGVVRAPQE